MTDIRLHQLSACLYFDAVAVAGDMVAHLLQKNQVRLVTLNACQSAFLQGGP
jgi:CHAT domain-containing protein